MKPNEVTEVTRAVLGIVLFCIGLTVDRRSLATVLGSAGGRAGFGVTLLSVALVMPAMALAACRLFSLDSAETLGLFIISVCPGGSFSNIAAAAFGASVPLNAALTVASSVLTLGMLPLACELILPAFLSQVAKPPMAELAINMSCIAGPLLLGFGVSGIASRRHPRAAAFLGRAAGPFGMLSLGAITLLSGSVRVVSPAAMACALCLAAFGHCWGFGLGGLLRQPFSIRASMALETAVHDAPLAQAVLLTAFAHESQPVLGGAVAVVYIYAASAVGLSIGAFFLRYAVRRALSHRGGADKGRPGLLDEEGGRSDGGGPTGPGEVADE